MEVLNRKRNVKAHSLVLRTNLRINANENKQIGRKAKSKLINNVFLAGRNIQMDVRATVELNCNVASAKAELSSVSSELREMSSGW